MQNIKKGELVKLSTTDPEIKSWLVGKGIQNYQNAKILTLNSRGAYIGFGKLALINLCFKDKHTKKLRWGSDFDPPVNDINPNTSNQIIHFSNKVLNKMQITSRNPEININDNISVVFIKWPEYFGNIQIKNKKLEGKVLAFDPWDPSSIEISAKKKMKRIGGSIIIGCGIYTKFIKTYDLPINVSYIYPNLENQIDFDIKNYNFIIKLPIRDIDIYYTIQKI